MHYFMRAYKQEDLLITTKCADARFTENIIHLA